MNKKPFSRADHVGSLLRPQKLLDARDQFLNDSLPGQRLQEIEDECIHDAVKLQEDIGLPVVTDGEFRRKNWWIDFIEKINGVEIHEGDESAKFITEEGNEWDYVPKDVKTVSKLSIDPGVLVRDYRILAEATTETAKITLPSPTRMHFHGGRRNIDQSVYPDVEDFFQDVAALYRQEIAELEKAGCRYIQIDDPLLTYFCSDRLTENLKKQGDEPKALLKRYVQLLNDCIRDRNPGTQLSIHLCRGNSRSSWISEGGYENISGEVFPNLDVDAYFLEYDDPRSGTFEPLKDIPKGIKVVLGLITTKKPDLENKDDLKRRIDEASVYMDKGDMAISPQCGFASVVEGNIITPDDQYRKLSLMVETAEEIWG